MELRKPAEVFHVTDYLQEEMEERGWMRVDLARLMDPEDPETQLLALDLYWTRSPGLLLGEDGAAKLAKVFDTGPDIWANLDKAWQAANPSR